MLTRPFNKDFGPYFLTTFIVENSDKIDNQFVCMYLIDKDPKTYQEALSSVDSIFGIDN